MIKQKIRESRGISLVSLTVTVIVLMILTNIIIYNVTGNLKIQRLKAMQADISNLRDKISIYYEENGKIPASIQYTNIEAIKSAGVISNVVDIGNFLVIDLSALDNLTLNYGEDFEKIKQMSQTDNVNNYTDLYIINEASHNVFYVAGINIDNDIFYTDYTSESIDTKAVDLRYVENIKIPDGFHYVEGTKDTGIVIKNNDNTKEYEWIVSNHKIVEIPNDVNLDIAQTEDFIQSVNSYQGYYKSTNSNEVIYLELENWSQVYNEEGTYKDKNGEIAYIPQGFQVSETPGQNTINEGLVVKDSKNNEWVWIEVPKSIYITAKSSEDYENIETDMQTYASSYRNSKYTDTWYNGCGIDTEAEYNNLKNTMLKSVYEKGGFYLARYEIGTDTARVSESAKETTPIIKQDAFPYNYVTCKQAQTLSKSLATEEKTTSLMFGIQWDLVLKLIETRDGKMQSELKTDSTTWGNYSNATFSIIKGKYTTDPSISNSWKVVSNSYTKSNSAELLATGVTNRNATLNIYDLAGNVWEFTLEYTGDSSAPMARRGGGYGVSGSDYPGFCRVSNSAILTDKYTGFRSVLY